MEEDFAELFGSGRIAKQMESSFRTVVAKTSGPNKLIEDIFLQTGPGPTVIRALQSHNAIYFSTVVQCESLHSVAYPFYSLNGGSSYGYMAHSEISRADENNNC